MKLSIFVRPFALLWFSLAVSCQSGAPTVDGPGGVTVLVGSRPTVEAKMSLIPQIEFKFTEHPWVTTARRSYLATDIYAFFQGNALHQWHEQILVRCVFHKQLDGQSFTH